MTKAEKEAKELVDEFYFEKISNNIRVYKITRMTLNEAKKCAIIHVDRMMKTLNKYGELQILTSWANVIEYWQDVKEAIKKI